MTTESGFDFSDLRAAMADFSQKARESLEKTQSAFGDYHELTRDNVDAAVESGKILASGLQEISTAMVADGREAFEQLTGEVKELAAARSPSDFFRLHNDLMKKQFDLALSIGSRQSDAWMRLMNEASLPFSARMAAKAPASDEAD